MGGTTTRNVVLKMLIIAVIACVLSPPVTDPVLFSVLFLAVLTAIFSELLVDAKRWMAAAAIVACSLLLQIVWPETKIAEQNNLFLRLVDGEPLQRALPELVYADMARSFERQYPFAGHCEKGKGGCWVTEGVPRTGLSWSADRAFGPPTRVVSSIDFNSIGTFRLGVINESQYNWYNAASSPDAAVSDIKRESAPFFVAYEFPSSLVGSVLCIRGTSLWQMGATDPVKFTDKETSCRQITHPETKVYAYSFDPAAPLAMQLRKTPSRRAFDLAVFFLRVFSALLIPLLVVRPQITSTFPTAIGIASLFAICWTYPRLLTEFSVYGGGGDGLTHEGYGRLILQAAIRGDWRVALKGVEPVFYFMPGLRYFRAMEKLAFGDTNLGYASAVAALPIAVYVILKELVPTRIAFVLAAGFVLSIFRPSLPLGYLPYVGFAEEGYPDTLGYLFFLIALVYGFKTAQDQKQRVYPVACGFTFALAVFVRPNLVIGSAVFLILLGLLLVKERQWRTLFNVALGVSPALLITLHNYVFGGKLVLLTAAAFIKENLFLTPAQYASAIASQLFGRGDPADFLHVEEHLKEWLVILPGRQAYLLNLILLAVTTLVCCLPRQAWRVRTLFWTALSLHAGLWFWHANGRYALLSWLLTVLALVGGIAALWRGPVPIGLGAVKDWRGATLGIAGSSTVRTANSVVQKDDH